MELNPSNMLSLVDEFWGAKYTGYITPFKVIRENGKNFGVPMAVDFSNLYVLKHLSGQPDAVVAGTRRGVISDPLMVGVNSYNPPSIVIDNLFYKKRLYCKLFY